MGISCDRFDRTSGCWYPYAFRRSETAGLIAMALAQDTEIVILDEPTTFLDPAHQLEVLLLLKRINENMGKRSLCRFTI